MSDFEETFGTGSNIESIIGSIDAANRREEAENRRHEKAFKEVFSSYQEALAWAKQNPNQPFKRFESNPGLFISVRAFDLFRQR